VDTPELIKVEKDKKKLNAVCGVKFKFKVKETYEARNRRLCERGSVQCDLKVL